MKPDLRRRPIQSITLRLTAAEREAWRAAADRERLTLQQWLRAAAELAVARGGTR